MILIQFFLFYQLCFGKYSHSGAIKGPKTRLKEMLDQGTATLKENGDEKVVATDETCMLVLGFIKNTFMIRFFSFLFQR